MILVEIEKVLRERKRMSLRELSIHFDAPPAALEPMLNKLVQKGRVNVLNAKGCGGSCKGCFCADRDEMLIYARNSGGTK